MLQNLFSLRQFRLTKWSFFVHSTTRNVPYVHRGSDFIWDFRKLPFSSHLGKYFITIGKISAKIHEIGKIKTIF